MGHQDRLKQRSRGGSSAIPLVLYFLALGIAVSSCAVEGGPRGLDAADRTGESVIDEALEVVANLGVVHEILYSQAIVDECGLPPGTSASIRSLGLRVDQTDPVVLAIRDGWTRAFAGRVDFAAEEDGNGYRGALDGGRDAGGVSILIFAPAEGILQITASSGCYLSD